MRRFIILQALLIAVICPIASGATLNVPDDYETIQAGIDASEDGDTVLVQPGRYVENIDFNGHNIVLGSLYLTTGDTAYVDSTVIDGDASGNVVSILNNEGVEVSGLTIRNGRAERIDIDDRHWYYAGGGIYSIHSSLVLNRCLVTENDAVARYYSGGGAYLKGGGAYLIGGTITLADCRFSANVGDSGYSAGMIADSTTITVRNCLFTGNGYGASIGASYYGRSTVTIDSCSFLGNNGSGLGIGDATVTIKDCSFQENNGSGLGIGGCRGNIARCSFIGNAGGILAGSNPDLIVDECLFEDNTAFEGGGIWFSSSGSGTVRNCTFRNNQAQFGGAISALHGAEITMENCLLVGNSAGQWGGALYGRDMVEVDVVNCTLYGNSAEQGGGAIGIRLGFSPLLKNSILYENGEHQIYCADGGILFVMYSLIQGGRDDVVLNDHGQIERWDESIDADPHFVNADEEDFHLTAESPCIDTGDPNSPKDPDSTRADMGAFYFHYRDIDVEPDSIVFAPTGTDEMAVDSLTIGNFGGDILKVDSLWLEQDEAVFEITGGGDPFNLEPQGAHETVIAFAPEAEGEYRAVLKIASNDPDEGLIEVPISGAAIACAPDITADADTLDFGSVAVGDQSERTLTVANRGNQVLNIWSVSLLHEESGFEIVSGGGLQQLMPDSSFQIVLQFAPNREGDFTDSLIISSDDEDMPALDITLWGVSPLSVNGGSGGPVEFGLGRISPNPFNATVVVGYRLSVVGEVSLRLYDITGRLALTVAEGRESAGEHRATIDGSSLASGIYIARLEAGGRTDARKVVCVK